MWGFRLRCYSSIFDLEFMTYKIPSLCLVIFKLLMLFYLFIVTPPDYQPAGFEVFKIL